VYMLCIYTCMHIYIEIQDPTPVCGGIRRAFVCLCVCMFMCIYTYMHNVHVCVCMFMCIYTYMHKCTYACIQGNTTVRRQMSGMCIYVCIRLCTLIHACTCISSMLYTFAQQYTTHTHCLYTHICPALYTHLPSSILYTHIAQHRRRTA
jgi:hypothetical protein